MTHIYLSASRSNRFAINFLATTGCLERASRILGLKIPPSPLTYLRDDKFLHVGRMGLALRRQQVGV